MSWNWNESAQKPRVTKTEHVQNYSMDHSWGGWLLEHLGTPKLHEKSPRIPPNRETGMRMRREESFWKPEIIFYPSKDWDISLFLQFTCCFPLRNHLIHSKILSEKKPLHHQRKESVKHCFFSLNDPFSKAIQQKLLQQQFPQKQLLPHNTQLQNAAFQMK